MKRFVGSEQDRSMAAFEALGAVSFGRYMSDIEISGDVLCSINSIHSETTPDERKLIFNIVSKYWNGIGDILEVGTYLGGTTRCLGLGLLANDAAREGRLIACDRFEAYHHAGRLRSDATPLLEMISSRAEVEAELAARRWRKLFEELHSASSFGPRMTIVEDALPDRPDAAPPEALVRHVDAVTHLGVLFIDGCKSWYATKALLRLCVGKMGRGSLVLSQDYGRHTCFWLPTFFGCFPDAFELIATVSGTAVFRYSRDVTAVEIDERFPDSPEQFGSRRFHELFRELNRRAIARSDVRAVFTHAINLAGALATIGERDAAIELMDWTGGSQWQPYRALAEEASVTPTFTPSAPIYLHHDLNRRPEKAQVAKPTCNVCGGVEFVAGFRGRMTRGIAPMCATCKSVERHRVIRSIYAAIRPLLSDWRALMFAADLSVERSWFKSFQPSQFGTETGIDMAETGLPDSSFDIVMSNHVLEHVGDEEAALRELLRLVGETGVVHLSVPTPMHRWRTADWGFADPSVNEHFRDYGADAAWRLSVRTAPAMVLAVLDRDIITAEPECLFFISRNEKLLNDIWQHLKLKNIPSLLFSGAAAGVDNPHAVET